MYIILPRPSGRLCRLRTSTAIALMMALTIATPALAEGSAPPSSTIVVTATRDLPATGTKTDIPVIITPLDVQSVSFATLQDQGAVSLDQALVNVSGVTTGSGGGADDGQPFAEITIRGFGSDSHFRNGVRLDSFGSDSGTSAVQFANIESIDVLKGPAAILYGQVEPGGIVNIVTKQPQATPAYSAEAQFGSYAFKRAVADATGPLTGDGKLLYRLIGSWENAGSPVDLIYNHTNFIAPSLAWVPSSRDKVTLEAEYRFLDEGQNYGYIVAPWNAAVQNFVPQLGNIASNYGETSPLREVTWLTTARWNHSFSKAWSLTVQELYQTIAVNGAGIFPYYLQASAAFPSGNEVGRFVNNVFDHDYTISSNVDLVGHFRTGPVAHTLLIGGDLVHFTYDGGINQIGEPYTSFDANGNDISATFASYIDAFAPQHPGTPFIGPASLLIAGTQHEITGGAYIQDEATIAKRIHLLAGARLQYVHETQTSGYLAPPTPQPPLTGTRVTPRVGALWEATGWFNFYGNYAENFGASNGYAIQPSGLVVPPTAGRQWEVGGKFHSADNRFSATIAWYHLVKTNLPTPDPANPNFSLVIGEARSQGLEIDATGQILPGWSVIANYAYTDAITIQSDDPANPPGTPFGEVPKHLAHVWSSYEWQAGRFAGLKFGGGATFHGAEPYLYGGATPPYIPAWHTFDLMAAYGWKLAGHKITAQVNATNIFDRRHFSDIQTAGFPNLTDANGNPTYGGVTALYGAPRSITGSLRMEF